nr:hypothetical protein [Propionibacterium freudenreichii]
MAHAAGPEDRHRVTGADVELLDGAEGGDSGAEQRCGVDEVEPLGDAIGIIGGGHHVLGITAIDGLSGDLPVVTQHLATAGAELADAAGLP